MQLQKYSRTGSKLAVVFHDVLVYEPQRHEPVRRHEPISQNTNRFLPSNSNKPEILVEKIIISKNFGCRREPVHPVINETSPPSDVPVVKA